VAAAVLPRIAPLTVPEYPAAAGFGFVSARIKQCEINGLLYYQSSLFFIKNSFFCTSRKNPDGNNTNREDTDSDDTDDFNLHQRFGLNFNREARLHIDCEYLLTFFC
jgi:hypothetical protein